jgi:diacylglycerol kinase family enzyme
VELDVAPGTRYNVDGEVLAEGRAEFTVTPAAFALVVG